MALDNLSYEMAHNAAREADLDRDEARAFRRSCGWLAVIFLSLAGMLGMAVYLGGM